MDRGAWRCADTSVFEYAMYVCCVLMLLVPISLILISYSLILAAVLQMCSNEARKKAFATCSSHISVVGLFFGAAIFIYMRPKSYRSAKHDKFVSAFYTIFTPVLNPGHAGKEGPHLAMMAASRGFSRLLR